MAVGKSKNQLLNAGIIVTVVGAALWYFTQQNNLEHSNPTSNKTVTKPVPSAGENPAVEKTSTASNVPEGANIKSEASPGRAVSSVPAAFPADRVQVSPGEPTTQIPADNAEQMDSATSLNELPEDLKQQLNAPPPELPADLKAQLQATPGELPDDIKRSLQIPPRIVSIDEVNRPLSSSTPADLDYDEE